MVHKQIIIIRHGEKDLSDPIRLSSTGRIRADGLIGYFSKGFRVPQSIYAMRPSSTDTSHRCVDTVRPLAKHLEISVCIEFDKMEIDLLVDRILEDPNDVILVCWEHHMIPSIANLLRFPMEYWGFTPLTLETHQCFNATWVLCGRTLQVFPQFDIQKEKIIYTQPRNTPLFTWYRSRLACCFE